MKNAAVILSSLSLIGVLILFGLHFSHPASAPTAIVSTVPAAAGAVPGVRIAYVNTDSFESKYILLKTKKQEFNTRQEQMEGELQRSYLQMQNDANEMQKKAEANSLTQAEIESAQKRLMQMKQSLETRRQSLTDQLVKQQEEINKELKTRLDAYLEEYNKTHHYDYIISFAGAGSPVLYANKQLDITQDVVDGMNAASKTDDTKKK
jgi:outer membrane protein